MKIIHTEEYETIARGHESHAEGFYTECRKKQLPEILANKSYELVTIYNMNYWLVEINVFE